MSKVALISGGSRGIGRQIAIELVAVGYKVAVIYLNNEEMADGLIKKLNMNDLNAIAIRADVRDYSQLISAVEKINKTFGEIELLVNNVGIAYNGLLMDMSCQDWDNVINSNLRSAFYLSKLTMGNMLSLERGCIINISSVWGVYGASCEVAYSASKAGIIGFTKALSKEMGGSNIRVNCISCGLIDTDMNANLSVGDLDELIGITPLRRIGTPKDVADVCVFLASDKAKFITGENIEVSGGFKG